MVLRIAIIECDVPMPLLVEEFGTYTKYFQTLLCSSVDAARASALDFITYEAYLNAPLPKSEEELRGFDGLIFTGSKFTSYDDDQWILATLDLIRLAYGKIKMVGICFGHQLIARALGGEVAANPKGWEIAVTSTTTFACELLPSLKALRLQQMHRDIVTKVPPGAQVVGSNDICRVQAMYEPGKYFSVQGHPEFNERTVEVVLRNRIERGIVPPDYGKDALARAGLDTDASVVGAAVVQFFEKTNA